MVEHTPTPWKAEPEYEGDKQVFIHKDGRSIADCAMGYGDDEANAAYIVRACNAFPDLVKALEAASPIVSDRAAGGRMLTSKAHAIEVFDLMQGALAAVKGASDHG